MLFLFLFLSVVKIGECRGEISTIPVYQLRVKIFPENNSITGQARIEFPGSVQAGLHANGLSITGFRVNGKESPFQDSRVETPGLDSMKNIVEIAYRAQFTPATVKTDMENTGVVQGNSIDSEMLMLLSNWYPEIDMPCLFELTAEVPSDFVLVSETDTTEIQILNEIKEVRFNFPYPVPGISLVGGKYNVTEHDYRGITLKTCFFSKDDALAESYLRHTKTYLDRYEALLGKYPYKRFIVVENKYQTGYSFPTYTLLGSRVIRLPFIVKTSLGHEFLHQWFGNHVYVDAGRGNWSEGLTTYLSDHWYAHQQGNGASYRKKILIDYGNYVDPDNEQGLEEFKHRENLSTRIIGYGKAAMVFHDLRKALGDDLFFKSLRTFIAHNKYARASWEDIKQSFLVTAPHKKERIERMQQWLSGTGVPSISLQKPSVVYRDGKYRLSLELFMKPPDFVIELPVKIVTTAGEERFLVRLDKEVVHITKAFLNRPLKIVADEDYDIMRHLTDAERPPVISAFTGRKDSLVVVPEDAGEGINEIADFFKGQGYRVISDKEVKHSDLKDASALLLTPESNIYKRFFTGEPILNTGFSIKVFTNPLNSKRVIMLFHAENVDAMIASYRKIFHYGNYSTIHFIKGIRQTGSTASSDQGIVADLALSMNAVELKTTLGIDDVIERIRDRKVIYVGERHDQYAHHLVQFEIIRGLHRHNQNLIIGMEMFQRPFQIYLDQYIQGELSEEAFLKKTEYFKRWRYDYNLYRDILQLARSQHIPVIALNLRR